METERTDRQLLDEIRAHYAKTWPNIILHMSLYIDKLKRQIAELNAAKGTSND